MAFPLRPLSAQAKPQEPAAPARVRKRKAPVRRPLPWQPHRRRGEILFLALVRIAPVVVLAGFLLPVLLGLAGTVFPAFGWLPALGHRNFSFAPFHIVFAHPSFLGALRASLVSGVNRKLSCPRSCPRLCRLLLGKAAGFAWHVRTTPRLSSNSPRRLCSRLGLCFGSERLCSATHQRILCHARSAANNRDHPRPARMGTRLCP